MRLIGMLICLIVTRSDITFAVGILSRFMHEGREAHWSAALRILAYIKSCPGKGLCIRCMDMYTSLDTLIQDMLVTEVIGRLLLVIVHFLRKFCELEEQEVRYSISLKCRS